MGRGLARGLFISSITIVNDLDNGNQDNQFLNYKTLLIPIAIRILGETIYYIAGKGTVYIPLLIDDSSTYTVATKAFFIPELPYKLLLELALKKRKQLYIRPNREIGSRTIQRYLDNLVVSRATYTNGLYVV